MITIFPVVDQVRQTMTRRGRCESPHRGRLFAAVRVRTAGEGLPVETTAYHHAQLLAAAEQRVLLEEITPCSARPR
ncbi:hypothetical protein GCM10010324_20360 [Streptomyces hiroshimensis]|uniref:Uncharacterized protein n=1 Tax=Streptomyces hiroshimensis TaxID=66424 RepID=A0ABQ2Y9V8_9ACTN|nr:hypothetical protein GCM10010324_20360 [Streptomyces hiroshimensis]